LKQRFIRPLKPFKIPFTDLDPQTRYTVGAVDPPKAHVDPTVVYVAKNPFFISSSLKKCCHIKVADKPLEDGEGWIGIWESSDGYFLSI
jgi:hypothetical protein